MHPAAKQPRSPVAPILAVATGLLLGLAACPASDDAFRDSGPGNDGGSTLPDTTEDASAWDSAHDGDSGAASDATGDDLSPGHDARTDGRRDANGAVRCPPCMVLVDETYCMDRYEASRPDATDSSQGTRSDVARCAPGVIPWHAPTLTRQDAATACEAADKRLCTTSEWLSACQGPTPRVYSYGDDYDPVICNGIDRFCSCDPYPHCYGTCGADFHVAPTGSHSGCASTWGMFDVNGNVWEVVDHGDHTDHFRGGAYNCGDSEALHRCDYDATWGPSARGFRCCRDPITDR